MPATRSIQTTIALQGEAAFRREMQSVNRNLRTLKAEVQATASAFQTQGRTIEALRNHQNALRAVYDQTRQKAEDLKQAVADAAEKYGENSKEADRHREALAKARAEMSSYDAAIRKVSKELEDAENAERDAANGMEELGESTQEAASQLGVMDVALGNIIANLAQKGVQLLKDIGKVGIEYNAQIESYTMAMTTALGSAEAAAAAIADIKLDAAVTPYAVDALVRANQLLIAAGESAGDARATIMALSDAVSATGGGNDELMRMAQNLQQIKNVGKATAMDIKQFQMAGIDVYGILAEYTGLAVEDAAKLTVTYDLLARALQAAAEEGGRYFGANADQAATLNGQISTLKDNVKSKLGEAFQSVSNTLSRDLLPKANEFISNLDVAEVVEGFENLVTVVGAVGGAIAALNAAKKISAWATETRNVVIAFDNATLSMSAAEAATELMNGKLTVTQILYGALSGEIDSATIKQLGLNAATAAFPAAIFVAGVTAVAVAAKNAYEEGKKLREEMKESFESDAMSSDNIEEVAASLDKLLTRRRELQDLINAAGGVKGLTKEEAIEYQALGTAISDVTAHLEDLKTKEAEQQAYLESTEGKIETVKASLEELQEAYDKAYQSAYDSLMGQFDLFDQVEPVVAGSYEDIMKALESQAAYYNSYADNLELLRGLTAGGISLNAEFVESLTDGSEKSVKAVATIAQGFQDEFAKGGEESAAAYLAGFNTAFEEKKEAAKRTAQEMEADLKAQIEEMEGQLDDLTKQLSKEEEAKAAAENTADGFIQGIASKIEEMNAAMFDAGSQANASFQAGLNSGSLSLPPINFQGAGRIGRVDGSHAKGLDYVPYDGYIAELHKREMIVPAPAADAIRAGRIGSKTEINLYPQTVDESTVDYIYQRFVQKAGDAI